MRNHRTAPVTKVPADASVVVATLNAFGLREDWPARREVLRRCFMDLAADVVAFQEVIVTGECDQVRQIVDDSYEIVHHSQRDPDGQGISLASRFPVRTVREIDLHEGSRPTDVPCSALVAEVGSPAGQLAIINPMSDYRLNHELERERQAVALANALEALSQEKRLHLVIAGDLNATPDSSSVRFWTGRQSLGGTSVCYRDSWIAINGNDPGHTFTPKNSLATTGESGEWELELGRRIDYVLVRCIEYGPTLDTIWCRRILDQAVEGVWGSDHFGVAARLSSQTPSGRSAPWT